VGWCDQIDDEGDDWPKIYGGGAMQKKEVQYLARKRPTTRNIHLRLSIKPVRRKVWGVSKR